MSHLYLLSPPLLRLLDSNMLDTQFTRTLETVDEHHHLLVVMVRLCFMAILDLLLLVASYMFMDM